MEIKRSFMQRSKAERITRPNPEAIEKGSSGLEELLDWARLAVTEFVQAGVQGTVVLDGVAIGVEQCGVKVTERAVTGLAIVWQADVSAPQIDASVVTG